jgi:hypothetical protein
MVRTLAVVGLAVALSWAIGLKGDGIGYFLNTDGTFGITVGESVPLENWHPSWLSAYDSLSIGHWIDGVIGSKMDSLPNHLNASVAANMRLLGWPGKHWGFAVSVPGIGAEATQDFRKANWTASANVTIVNMSVSNFLYNLLYDDSDPMNTLGPRPVSFAIGYSYVGDWLGPDTLGPGWHQRIDGRLFLTFALTKNLSLGFLGQAFNQPGDAFKVSTWKYMAEPAVTYRLKGIWMHAKYERGSLPPLYEPVKKWDVGVGFAFD